MVGLAVHRHEKYVAAPAYDINLPQLATVQSRVSDLPVGLDSQTATNAMAVTNENSFATVSAVAVVADTLLAPCASAVAMTAA
jgi:hypothetical protein